MPTRNYSVEQIVVKLREHEKLQGKGLTILQVWGSTNKSCFSKALERTLTSAISDCGRISSLSGLAEQPVFPLGSGPGSKRL